MKLRSAAQACKPNVQPPQKTNKPNLLSSSLPENLEQKSLKRPKIIIPNTSRLPMLGSSSFKDLRENGAIIDKTEFIYELLENNKKIDAAFFPRRFGKSTNLDMVKTFVELEFEKDGIELEEKNKKNPTYFLGGTVVTSKSKKKFLEPLLISKHKDIIDGSMGKFPTIYLDLKSIGHGNDFEEICYSLSECILKEYQRHAYLENSPKLEQREREKIKKIRDFDEIQSKALPNSLKNLSELLRKHWNQKVFVFIDEYDAPINNVFWSETFPKSSINKVISKFSDVFSNLLKSNDDNVEKALITGIFHIEQAGFLSGLNNIIKLTPLKPGFGKNYYGFNERDIKLLVHNNGIDEKYLEMIKIWYDGYLLDDIEIYNPWSIINCLSELLGNRGEKSFGNYWENTGKIQEAGNV